MKKILLIAATFASSFAYCEETYYNPIDQKAYVTDHWKTYSGSGKKIQVGRVYMENVRLLSSESDISASMPASNLADFIKELQARVAEVTSEDSGTGELLIQITFSESGKNEYMHAFRGNLSEMYLAKVKAAIQKLPSIKTQTKPISFQVHLKVA